jgi:hypothetical protein
LSEGAQAFQSGEEILMSCNIKSICLSATLCTVALFAQVAKTQTTSSAVAYVYVSNTLTGGTSEVHAYAAAKNGQLTPVNGSPFPADVNSMAVNGTYLFGSSSDGTSADSYAIESDGSLRLAAVNNIVINNYNACGFSGPIFFDHTGSTLYDMEFRGDCSNNMYQSFNVNKPTGQLQNLGNSGPNSWLYLPASFIGNNVYAYSASCLGDMYWGIFSFRRASNGLLTQINASAAPPTPPTGYFYCPSLAAADPTNHVAITMQPVNQANFSPDRPAQIAAYTADSAGNLVTTNTRANMPHTLVGTVNDIKMAPSGKLLAVGGTAGLQVFHFNGSQPITQFTGLLTTDAIDQFFWDNTNHLYAISSAGKLFVFTVTPTGVKHAPGSPYSITAPHNIIVQPLPRY